MKVSFSNYTGSMQFRARDNFPVFCAAKNDTDNIITPKELYDRFRTGERPACIPSVPADKSEERLSYLAERYKAHPTIKNKTVLLNHERKMLYEELQHPELTLSRNYKQISSIIPKETSPSEVDDIITNFNLIGLSRIERLSKPFETRYTTKKAALLDKIYDKADEKSEFGNAIKNNAIATIDGISCMKKNYKSEINNDDISEFIDFYNHEKSPKTLSVILQLGKKENQPQITKLVETVLASPKTDDETRLYALWGAGRYRSDKNFIMAKSVALNPNSDIKQREFALHSVALYLKDKPQEVAEVLDKVSNDGSVFEPLAKVLKGKVTGNYYNVVDREYDKLSEEEKKAFRYFTKNHIYYDKNLNRRKQNAVDKDLILYKNQIAKDPDMFNPIAIIRDTYTRLYLKEAGERNFTQGLKNNGCFADSVDGIHTDRVIILKNDLIADWNNYSAVAHEMGHELNGYLSDSELRTLNKLYQKSLKRGNPLGDYAGRNVEEYFAVGCDSMSTVYKPHSALLSSDYGNTRYTLMAKDPDLYGFILKVTGGKE